ncbi:maturase K [Gossypium australe]|uniref:Maturase K n=1 Tax=Gossypium australe TaxID=47621 RepID=A0A5B6VAA2_9ROSI|nr:maturase K [Gossypium australe]
MVEVVRRERPLVDKIWKQGAEEFRASKDDDPERLENTIKVFDELSCTPEKCIKCVVSLLKDSAYQWWNTLVSVVPRERVNWEFFQEEFRNFIDQRRKEFLKIKQGRMTVTEYEHEFIRLSKYARECVLTEAIMYQRFEDGINEDIHLFVGVLELKEFVVLVDRACKAEELDKEKRSTEIESRDSRKRLLCKSFQSSSKKSREFTTRSTTSAGFSNKSKGRQSPGLKLRPPRLLVLATLDRMTEMSAKEKPQNARPGSTVRGRPQRNPRNEMSSKNISRSRLQELRVEHRREHMSFVLAKRRPPPM